MSGIEHTTFLLVGQHFNQQRGPKYSQAINILTAPNERLMQIVSKVDCITIINLLRTLTQITYFSGNHDKHRIQIVGKITYL
jgi:hypothetical protein